MVKLEEVRQKAKDLGIKTGKLRKAELIRAIQEAEGNFPCFGTPENGECDQLECLWRDDCLQKAE
jgi:hypothetical protein